MVRLRYCIFISASVAVIGTFLIRHAALPLPSQIANYQFKPQNKTKVGIILSSPEESAYSLAMKRFWVRTKSDTEQNFYLDLKSQYKATGAGAITNQIRLLNSVRVPKAGSSALSVIARALAGCGPDGYPCCGFPGDPKGSCPREDLFCPLITGCVGHHPNYQGNETIITSLRDPVSRTTSAFFYYPPHTTVKIGEPHTWEKFVENVQSPRFRNVMTKMLSGRYAYESFEESKHTVEKAKLRLCLVSWFVLSEMPVASSLMLYETKEFQQLMPNPVAFGLPVLNSLNDAKEKVSGLRINNSSEYKVFLATTFADNNGTAFVINHNQQDMEVFKFAEKLFCARLFSFPGLVYDMKSIGLGTEEIEKCVNIGLRGVDQLCSS
jgi:hypothetical protein